MGRTTTATKWVVLLPIYTIVWGARIAWACTLGWFLAGMYLAAGFCLSPFGMAYTGHGHHARDTALNIWFLTPGKKWSN